jgi:hypothetical protein
MVDLKPPPEKDTPMDLVHYLENNGTPGRPTQKERSEWGGGSELQQPPIPDMKPLIAAAVVAERNKRELHDAQREVTNFDGNELSPEYKKLIADHESLIKSVEAAQREVERVSNINVSKIQHQNKALRRFHPYKGRGGGTKTTKSKHKKHKKHTRKSSKSKHKKHKKHTRKSSKSKHKKQRRKTN